MHLNIKIIQSLCQTLNLKCTQIDPMGVFLSVDFEWGKHFFIANNLGLNSQVVSKICNDKYYSYLLLKDVVQMPLTFSFTDPKAEDVFQKYVVEQSFDQILQKSLADLQLPIIIKANSQSRGQNVYACHNSAHVMTAIKTIFDQKSKDYDHVLLAQRLTTNKKEYRVIVYQQKVQFLYQKNIDEAKFVGNLSPLHWFNSSAELINDQKLIDKIQKFIEPIFTQIDLKYSGIDIILDNDDNLWLVELNASPGFTLFVRDNGPEKLINLFRQILLDLKSGYNIQNYSATQ